MEVYKQCEEFKCTGCNFTANVKYSLTVDLLKDESLCCHCMMKCFDDTGHITLIEASEVNSIIICASCQKQLSDEDLANTTCKLCKGEAK